MKTLRIYDLTPSRVRPGPRGPYVMGRFDFFEREEINGHGVGQCLLVFVRKKAAGAELGGLQLDMTRTASFSHHI